MIGAVLAGMFFLIKDGVPWLSAQLSGTIRARGHKREAVERAVDPSRFHNLSRQRFKGMSLGLIAFAVGLGWLILPSVLATVGVIMALAIGTATH